MAVAEPLHFTDDVRTALIIDIRKAELTLVMLEATYNVSQDLILEVAKQEGIDMSVRDELIRLQATRLRLDRQITQLTNRMNGRG
jgi:hypothetical protein